MNDTSYKEIHCESALNELKRKVPFGWDLNIYRGCSHACRYCYAIYSHTYLNSAGFYDDIYVKTNIVEKLERELSSPKWKREVVNIGGVTDSYQKAEETYQLMPEILKLLIKYKTPAIISTKSTLVLRDYDLINELSQITYINIAATITTMDEEVRKKIEPGGAPSSERFAMLKQFRQTNASVGLHVMPIIPYLTDGRENFEALCIGAKESGVHYLLPGALYLRGDTRKVFFDFIQRDYPQFYPQLQTMYKTGAADKNYKDQLYMMVNELRDRYGISSSYSKPMKEKMLR
ncbi:radical SAM protein [bacterium]|nr:radical SAM protein [bacterium]